MLSEAFTIFPFFASGAFLALSLKAVSALYGFGFCGIYFVLLPTLGTVFGCPVLMHGVIFLIIVIRYYVSSAASVKGYACWCTLAVSPGR